PVGSATFTGPEGVALDGAGNIYVTDSVSQTIRKYAPAPLPQLLAQPQNQVVATGASATFSVSATSTMPLSYQWLKNGAVIAGATSASYTIAAVRSTDAGGYSVRVTTDGSAVTSDLATLLLAAVPPPQIAAQPQAQGAITGQSVTFAVTATGTGPFA